MGSFFLTLLLFVTPAIAQGVLPDPGTLPGGWFYPVKLWMEEVGDWFTFGETRTMNRLLDRSSLRLSELHALKNIDEAMEHIKDAERAYAEVWQEFWSHLDRVDDPIELGSKAVRLLMDHEGAIDIPDINLKTVIRSGEIRGIKMLLEKESEEGGALLKELLTDTHDVLALDPLVGLLRTHGEKKVITMMVDILPVIRDKAVPDNRIEQYVFQTIRGDLIRYTAANPDDAVAILNTMLEQHLNDIQRSVQNADDVRILKNLGAFSLVVGLTEDVGQELLLPSRAPAAQGLKNVLQSIGFRLGELSIPAHEGMVRDQQERIKGVIQMVGNAGMRDDLTRVIPSEILKMFPDLPWKIPVARPGIPVSTDHTQRVLIPDKNSFIKKNTPLDIQETLKSRFGSFMSLPAQPATGPGEDPSARLQEMLRERNGILSPLPIDLKNQVVPMVR